MIINLRNKRNTKIVATLGPSSSSPKTLEAILRAGVNVVRLNFSHGSANDHIERAQLIREIAKKLGKEIAIMADLQGPKIRIGKFIHNKIELLVNTPFILDANCILGDAYRVGLDYKNLPKDVKNNDILLLNDGLIQLRVKKVIDHEIHTVVELGGELSNNKGINRKGGGLTAPALTEKDKEDLKVAMALKADYIAISFPKNKADMEIARQLAITAGESNNHTTHLIAKIERAEAIVPSVLEGILEVSDGIMVARGDLAVEVGNAAVPALQKKMIKLARQMDKIVITATQMMESMIVNPIPTRAEVSDVANAVLDGTDAVMLSAETASGKFPVETVLQMANIAEQAEQFQDNNLLDTHFLNVQFHRIDQSIAMGALFTAHHLNCKAIIALTDSGSTALWMSRQHINTPIYALTTKISSQRKMALYRNVRPIYMDTALDKETALKQAEALLKSKGVLNTGDLYVITCGEPMGEPGGTNMLKICKVL